MSVVDVKVDWVVTDLGLVMENADLGTSVVDVEMDLAMTDGVFVIETAAFDMSVVDFNEGKHFAPDNSIFLVP